MAAALAGKRIAILVANGTEQTEMTVIGEVLAESRARPTLLSVKKAELRGWINTEWGRSFPVDACVLDAAPAEYEGLIIPGGLIAADTLRSDKHVTSLVRGFLDQGKPVAAVGHAPWVLIEAGAVRGRAVTSIAAIRSDLENAGATWLDRAAVADGPVVTGRHHHDLPDFMAQFVETLLVAK